LNKYLYIVNPISGKGRGKKVVPLIKSLQNIENHIQIIETKYPLHATEIVRNLVSYPDVIISVGGDGTLNEIINGISKETRCKISVLPVGSGNDFIKNFNFSKNIKDTLSFIHNPNMHHTTNADLGELIFTEHDERALKSHKFINNAGIGFDAQVGYLKQSNQRLTGIVSYIYAVIQALFDYNMINAELEFNNDKISGCKLMISIGNGISSGGGFYLNPNAIVDDGLLDLSVFDQVTRKRLLSALPLALFNKVKNIPEAKLFTSDRYRIYLQTPTFVHCDGEIVSKDCKTAEVKIHRNAVKFISKTHK
jgi:YegS/Rv2252/BmrU family lipid kinase